MAGKSARHYPCGHLKDDRPEEFREPLSRALDPSDKNFEHLSLEM